MTPPADAAAARSTAGGATAEASAAALWRTAWWLLLGLTLLRWLVLALSPLELYGDEAQYWTWSQSFDWGYFTKPPLIAWIIAATTAVFGDGEFGVRFAAPLCHAVAAAFIGLAARDAAGPRPGALAMLAYATLPAVSYSSLLMSTDAPLLAAFAAAFWAFMRLVRTRRLGWAMATGAAIAIGLNAKYAMGYFLLCAALYAVFAREARWLWRSPKGAVVVVLGLAGLIPNLLWNMANDWATVGHTAENANWSGPLLNFDSGLGFVASQFGVAGPIVFATLLILFWLWARGRAPAEVRAGLMFAAPILALITVQAFISRAHANWAAAAYVGGTIAVMLWLAAPRFRLWLRLSFMLHWIVAGGLYLFVVLANVMPWPSGRDPFAPLRGWAAAGAAVERMVAEADGPRIVLADDRMLLASLIHATRGSDLTFAALDTDDIPGNHYELTIPYDKAAAPPALLVSLYAETETWVEGYAVGERQDVEIPLGDDMVRTLYVWPVN